MNEHFERDPEVTGGRLCLAGTRVTVRAAELLLEQGLSDAEIAGELPVTREHMRAVGSEQQRRQEQRRRVLNALAEASWTPPSGAPDAVELLRADRDR